MIESQVKNCSKGNKKKEKKGKSGGKWQKVANFGGGRGSEMVGE